MQYDLKKLAIQVREHEKLLVNKIAGFLCDNMDKESLLSRDHFKQWLRLPMNYARIMELPLTDIMLDLQSGDRILDVSSPKLLAACYGLEPRQKLVAADLEDYFVGDFSAFAKAGVALETAVFDASKKIPFEDASFEKIFSVSVLEHIHGEGDRKALDEILRVLTPQGVAVLTLPVFREYVEEWTSNTSYWRTKQDGEGRNFFQRRYDEATLESRLGWRERGEMDYVLVAEKPIREPVMEDGGRLKHNSYLIKEWKIPWLIKGIGNRLRFRFADYYAERWVSRRCHYLTRDWQDPNIRQIAFYIRKTEQ